MNLTTAEHSLSKIAPTPVQAIGDLRLIASNELNSKVKFSSLTNKPHLYALGMPHGLNSELIVMNGKAYLAGLRHFWFKNSLKPIYSNTFTSNYLFS